MSGPHVPRRTTGPLDAAARAAVQRLAAAASAADAADALSEDALLRTRSGGDVTHLLLPDGEDLAGYAQLAGTAPGAVEGELLVAPGARRAGRGAALLAAVSAEAAGRPVRLWSHGDTPGAAALARRAGWRPVRELLRLERPVAGLAELVEPALPAGTEVGAFRPGADDEAWTALNAAAFADHPEQGRWTTADLRARRDEAWFDPALFLLARDTTGSGPTGSEPTGSGPTGSGLAGFCWMKVADGVGELYVLGVDPARAGAGLGRALLVRGLRAVAALPAAPAAVELYVDGDNVRAVRLYEGLGFTRAAVDVQYASPHASPADPSRG